MKHVISMSQASIFPTESGQMASRRQYKYSYIVLYTLHSLDSY